MVRPVTMFFDDDDDDDDNDDDDDVILYQLYMILYGHVLLYFFQNEGTDPFTSGQSFRIDCFFGGQFQKRKEIKQSKTNHKLLCVGNNFYGV